METDRVQRDRLQCVLHMYSSIVTTEDNNYVLPPENVLDVIHQDSLNRLKALIVSSRLLSNTHTHTRQFYRRVHSGMLGQVKFLPIQLLRAVSNCSTTK